MATDTKESKAPVEVLRISTQQEHAEELREATEIEHALTFLDAIRSYPKAIGWSVYFSVGVIMLCQ
jgi:hypothetical protein